MCYYDIKHMKAVTMKDILKKTLKELVALRGKNRKSLFELRLKNAVRSLSQTHLIAIARKNVARINTVIKQRESIAK